MTKKEHGPLYAHAREELLRAGLLENGKSPAETSIYHTTLKLVDQYEKGTVSDFTSGIIRGLFSELIQGHMIGEPSEDPNEWVQDDSGRIVNKYDRAIFTNDNGKTWFRLDGASGVSKEVKSHGNETKETV